MPTKSRKEQIQEMLAEDPRDSFLRYGLAMEWTSEGNTEAAIGCFQELLAHDPTYVPAYLQLGQAFVRLGKADDARQAWTKGVEVARRQGDGHAAEEMQGFLDGLG